MTGQDSGPDRRGGGDRARTDAFRYAPGRGGLLASLSIGALGALAIAVVALDLGGARARPGAVWIAPAGALLILAMLGLLWLSRRRLALWQELVMLRVDLAEGVRLRYKRRLWTWPSVDAWIARRYGLRVPVHNLDAAEGVILASVERFKPVQRVPA